MADADLLVVGGGPAGLAAAIAARGLGCSRVVVVDREEELGGIPRHADHIGFGIRDLYRLLSGPEYARRYVDLADRAGVTLRPATTVTHWLGPNRVCLTSPTGLEKLTADAIILATGCRERPRAARLVPGDRPRGIYTTGSLQQLVYLKHQRIGRRAVVVGAEHVSFSALLTLIHGGATVATMLTEHPQYQSYPPYKWLSATRHRVPILTRHRVIGITGQRQLEAIEIENLRTGAHRTLPCDTLVFTGDWISDHELARRLDLDFDHPSQTLRIDTALRTSLGGVFAAGNLVHAAETADVAALSGRHAAQAAVSFLADRQWPHRRVPIVCESPIQWISPNAISFDRPTPPPRQQFTWRIAALRTRATVRIEQAGRLLWRRRFRSLTPGLPLSVPGDWIRGVDAEAGPLTFGLETA